MGFTEKQKIAFAQSQTVPVIHDGTKVVKDSWAIAEHLDAAYPDKPLFSTTRRSLRALRQRLGRHGGATSRSSPSSSATCTIACGRSTGPDYFRRIARQAARHDRLRRLPGQGARERRRGLPRGAGAGAARPAGPEVPVGRGAGLSRLHPARHASCGRAPSARSSCWRRTTPVHAWRERMLDLFDGMGRKAQRLREIRRRRLRPADGADQFLDLVERRRRLGRRRHEMAPALSRDHLRLRRLPAL